MKTIINIILLALIALLVYLTITSIKTPIEFRKAKEKREKAVADRLKQIREVQEMHRQIYGEYAGDFNSLKNNIDTGIIMFVNVQEDPDAVEGAVEAFIYDTAYAQARDSVSGMGINMDSLSVVPYGSDGAQFVIATDTITYQSTLTHVLEVGVRRKDFMGEWADAKFAKYDDSYDPNSVMKFGSLSGPNLSGNWE